MKRTLYLIIIFCVFSTLALAQHTFQGASLSEALMELDQSSKHYNISFVYDELEDFTVTKTIKRGRALPDAVREVCGFYPVRVSVKGHDINVECIQKDRTKLTGRLIGPDRQPVVYANITLFSLNDSVYIGGGVSNEAGDFVIPCGMSQVKARISCVGFKTIEQKMPVGNVGTIRMQIENNYLGNVTVSGRMPVIRSEADRLQYIVNNDEFARGLNAQELLSRVPMVSMAGGRAMILGQGPARFMFNGRITEMGNEAIQQKLWTMRSEDIERIEVISNPSGREMMEMGGSYINIVMRRDQTLGWRGDVSTEVGVSDDWSGRGSGSVTYASEKFDMTVDVHGGRTTQTTDEMKDYHPSDEIKAILNTRAKQTDKEIAANLTFRLLPIKQLELGGMLSWQTCWPEILTDGTLSYISQSYMSKAYLKPFDNTQAKNLTAYCDWRIDSKGKLLSLTYNNYKKKEDTKNGLSNGIGTNSFYLSWRNNNADYHIQSGRLDLLLPINIVTIDAGVSYTSIKNMGVLSVLNNGDPFLQQYDYHEKNKAAYLSIHREWEKISFKAGLRYEHLALDRAAVENQFTFPGDFMTFRRDYWLPSLSFSVKPKDGHQISLSWGTSSIYPNFYELNPLRITTSGIETIEGYPLLEPSRTSRIELSYYNHQGFYASFYHHHASNVVDWRTMPSSRKEEFTVKTSSRNAGRINKTGLYLRYQYQMTPRLMASAEGEAYYHHHYDYLKTFQVATKSQIEYLDTTWQIGLGTPPTRYTASFYGWGERLAVSADWYLNRQRTLLLNARYQHWFSDYQVATKTDGYGYFYLALRYSTLNNRLRLSLVANDPFHQYVTDKTQYNIFTHTNHHAHYIGLTATYSFGGKKVRRIQYDTKDTERQRAEKKK